MLREPAHLISYLSTLQKPAAGAGFCNVLKYKADTFYLSRIQKPAPEMAEFYGFLYAYSVRILYIGFVLPVTIVFNLTSTYFCDYS